MDDRTERARRGGGARSNIWPTFIALNIALLAFFAMMVSASEPRAPITGAILASVRQSFAGPQAGADEAALFAAGRSALAELGGELHGMLRIVRISQPARGSELRLSLPVSSLFDEAAIAPAAAAMPLLDRITAALSAPPDVLRLTAMLTLPEEEPDDATTVAGSSDRMPRAALRAAALAGALAGRGAPPTAIAAGIGSTADDEALIVFRFQPAEDRRQP